MPQIATSTLLDTPYFFAIAREVGPVFTLSFGGGANKRARQPARDVLIDRQLDFRLRPIALDDDFEGLEIGEGGFGRRRRHALQRPPVP